MLRKVTAEFIGTAWLVLGGCGSAVLAAAFSATWYRVCRRIAGIRSNRIDHGLRHRSRLRLPSKSGCLGRALGRRALQGQRTAALCYRAGAGGRCRSCHSLCDRERKSRLRRSRWLRQQRLWRSFAGRIFDGGRPRLRGGDDLRLRLRDPWLDPWERTPGICTSPSAFA